jgi:transposase-like protein
MLKWVEPLLEMLMTVWIAVECPDCHSTDIIKHGKSSENKQRFLCQNSECLRRTFILDYTYSGRTRKVKRQIVEMSPLVTS